jgi:hypothetical protein
VYYNSNEKQSSVSFGAPVNEKPVYAVTHNLMANNLVMYPRNTSTEQTPKTLTSLYIPSNRDLYEQSKKRIKPRPQTQYLYRTNYRHKQIGNHPQKVSTITHFPNPSQIYNNFIFRY